MIVEGKLKLDVSKKKVTFGTYDLAYSETNKNTKGRTTPEIALRISNNDGGYYVMSLHICNHIHDCQQKELSVEEFVIKRVEFLVKCEEQPIMHNRYPNFEWESNETIIDEVNEYFDVDYLIVNILNNTDTFEEIIDDNNNENENI